VESTENIPGHFSRRIVKRTLSDESLVKIEPVVNNDVPSDAKQNEVTILNKLFTVHMEIIII